MSTHRRFITITLTIAAATPASNLAIAGIALAAVMLAGTLITVQALRMFAAMTASRRRDTIELVRAWRRH